MGKFSTEALAKRHDRGAFDCGMEELNVYLRQQASQDVKKLAAAVFVMVPADQPKRIAGFYTLSSASVRLSDIPEQRRTKFARYPDVPAILVGRLARDVGFPGLGAKLLVDAFTRSQRVADEIAATVILVDAKNDHARKFYQTFGFQAVLDRPDRLFLPMKTVADVLADD